MRSSTDLPLNITSLVSNPYLYLALYTLPRVSSLNPLPLNTLAALRNSISLLETYACTIESLFAIFIWIANKNFYFNEMKTGFYSPESLQSSSAYKASPHT